MSDGLILNESSLPFNSVHDCEQNLELFFSIIHEASRYGIEFYRADDREGEWNSLVYAEEFIFGKWIDSISKTSKDKSLLVKNVVSKVKCPLISINDHDLENSTKNMLFLLLAEQDIEVQGLGIASMTDNHGISFSSNEYWKVNPIAIIQQKDAGGEVEEKHINVTNVHSLECLNKTLEKFQEKKQSNRLYIDSLSASNNKDFPNLIFCKTALKDIRSSSVTSHDFKNIIDVLNKLNNAICESNNLVELIKLSELDISMESKETMDRNKFKRRRTFNHPTLGISLFEAHVKNFFNAKRMHILPEYDKNTICIGYFGRHLPTKNNPKP